MLVCTSSNCILWYSPCSKSRSLLSSSLGWCKSFPWACQLSHPIIYWTLKTTSLIFAAHSVTSVTIFHGIKALVMFPLATTLQHAHNFIQCNFVHAHNFVLPPHPYSCLELTFTGASSIHENICWASMAGTM